MLIQAGINAKEKGEFWCEVISTATNLDNIMVRPDRTKPPFTLFYNKDVKYMKHLRSFGEMTVVAIDEGGKMRSKLDNRGKTCMFVGYADDHVQISECKNQEDFYEQRCKVAEYNVETLQKETQLCKETSGTFPG